MLEMEVDKNGDRYNGKVDGESKPGEERAFVGTMISSIGGDIGEEKWRV